MKKTTTELVHLAMQNDQSAINDLYQQTYSGVYRTVKTMIKDDDTALDIVQDSYVKALRNLNQLLEPEKFSSWLNQIAANKARDYLKKRPVLFTEIENEDGEMPPIADDCFDHLPEEVLDRAETAHLIKDILDALPEEQRAVIFMLYYEQMSVKEIASALNCSENTVKSRLKYGREKVKVKVEQLEKKGTKLYSLAPLPFFLWLLRMARRQGVPAAELCPAVESTIRSASSASAVHGAQTTAAKTAAKTGAKTAAKAAAKSLTDKIVAAAVVLLLTGAACTAACLALHETEAPPVRSVISNGKTAGKEPAAEPAPAAETEEAPAAEQDPVVGTTISFGTLASYPVESGGIMQDESAIVEWIVLDADDEKALLLSKYAYSLYAPYNTEYTEVTWETGTMRQWLNGRFMSIFTPEEQAHILTSTVTGDKNPEYDTAPVRDTQDRLFLLSIDEVERYLGSTEERSFGEKALYGHTSGVITVRLAGYDGNWGWWLRTQGSTSSSAAYVDGNGVIHYDGAPVAEPLDVRPAMWVDISVLDAAVAEKNNQEK